MKTDSKAFLFSLDKLKIYKSNGEEYSIWNNENNSIDFGAGTDLRIYHNFLHKKNNTYQSSDYNYNGEEYSLNEENSFKVQYLELYKVIII